MFCSTFYPNYSIKNCAKFKLKRKCVELNWINVRRVWQPNENFLYLLLKGNRFYLNFFFEHFHVFRTLTKYEWWIDGCWMSVSNHFTSLPHHFLIKIMHQQKSNICCGWQSWSTTEKMAINIYTSRVRIINWMNECLTYKQNKAQRSLLPKIRTRQGTSCILSTLQ